MKRLLENHTLKNKDILDKDSNHIYRVEDVYELSFAGNAYISLLVYQLGKPRSHMQIDWEMTEQEEDSDIGIHWQTHIEDNRKRFELYYGEKKTNA